MKGSKPQWYLHLLASCKTIDQMLAHASINNDRLWQLAKFYRDMPAQTCEEFLKSLLRIPAEDWNKRGFIPETPTYHLAKGGFTDKEQAIILRLADQTVENFSHSPIVAFIRTAKGKRLSKRV